MTTNTRKSPLSLFRDKSSVPLNSLINQFEPQSPLRELKLLIWRTLEDDPVFQRPVHTPSAEEQKRQTARMLRRLMTLWPKFLPKEVMAGNYKSRTRHVMSMNEALAIVNRSLSVKFALGVSLFTNALPSLGTARHRKYVGPAWNGDLLSCFAITEIAHGSNTKSLRTTATYDPRTEEFVIHTPDFEAAKCWAGNLGRTCTFSIVFAQLRSQDGANHGLHGFIVPIRDRKTLLPFAGVTVGDMGEKAGLNGIDNGFVMFTHYRIPKANLLNKTGDVDKEGNYQSNFTNPQQVLGAALENLSAGRVAIAQESTNTLSCAVTIAVRYGAVRKQFGASSNEEQPLLYYPTHQWRLFPLVAAASVFKIFIFDFTELYLETVERSYSSDTARFNELSDAVGEIHAVVSCSKPLISWTCMQGIQVCREACGGHGYLKAAGLGDLRNDHDPSVTYEGDNTVLIQQTSNWLLRQWTVGNSKTPLNSIEFLANRDVILRETFKGTQIAHVTNPSFIRSAYEWLICWLLRETDFSLNQHQKDGIDRFTARAQTQVYGAGSLSLVFGEYVALVYCWNRLSNAKMEPATRTLIGKLTVIYGLWCLDKHLPFFYQGGYASGPDMTRLVRAGLQSQCRSLTPDVVTIVDALAPTDYALNSVLGYSDGLVYKHLEEALVTREATERVSWWKDAVSKL